MTGKTAEQMEEQNRTTRREIHRLMREEKLSESEALRRVLPSDRNRTKKLRRWKEKGLWPLPDSHVREGDLLSGDNSEIQRQPVKDGLSEAEVLRKVRAMLDTIEPAERPVGATAKGRKSPLQTTMIAIRIPTALDGELKSLGGLKSRHIEKAIMLYLKAMNVESDPDA